MKDWSKKGEQYLWLVNNDQEGLVFWLNGEPVCKIKRTDFGFKWPITK